MEGSLALVTILAAVFARASPHADHGSEPHFSKSGEHNTEHDQEAILGSKGAVDDFAKLSPEEALTKLGEIITKIDTNNDMFVSEGELTAWIMKSYILMDLEETQKTFPEYDADKDGKITWREYFEKTKRAVNDTTSDSFKSDMKQDKQKFDAADVDKDGGMSLMEFTTFWYPYDFENMHHIEIDLTMQQLDQNKDGKLDLKEFASEGDDSGEEANGDHFAKYDKDHDGLLDLEELRPWIVPSTEPEALSEAVHLIKETDTDNDGRLSRDEILSKIEMWGGSSITATGDHDEL